jgi:hypothetical protein
MFEVGLDSRRGWFLVGGLHLLGPALEPAQPDRRVGGGRENRGGVVSAAKPSQSAILAGIGTEAADLFHDGDNLAYAGVRIDDHCEVWPVRSSAFRSWLAGAYWRVTQAAPGGQAMTDALLVMESVARYDGPERSVALRIAKHGSAIYVDLCDAQWRVVEIDSAGWRILTASPVAFRRTPGMLPLPAPVRGGRVDDLRAYLNLGNSDDGDDRFRLLAGWALAACRPAGPYIVLVLGGEQGSAKSTTARLVRRLIDPNKAGDRSAPRDERDLAVATANGWIVSLDNLSRLLDWQSDALARLATGAGFATRRLFTDSDEFLIHVARPIIVNGIGSLATRSDLLDRAVLVELPRIGDEARRSEAEFWTSFDCDHPRLLGALLDAVSAALAGEGGVQLDRPPRMADATRWIMAAEPALRWPHGSFLAAYTRNRSSAHELALDAAPIVPALRVVVSSGSWTGTAAQLLAALAGKVGDEVTRGRDWPASSIALGNQLRRLAPDLRSTGMKIDFTRENGTGRRLIAISTPTNVVVTHVTAVTPEPADGANSDDSDDRQPSRANGTPMLWPASDDDDDGDGDPAARSALGVG